MSVFGVTGVLAVLVVLAVLLVVAVTATVLIARARRLDRLHVRTDAATAGLIAALDRRAAIARAVAATAGPVALGDADRRSLRAAAREASSAGTGEEREAAENDLAARLVPLDTAALPVELADELADAHVRVSVARRVHNDAVRDTRALRGRRMVRALHLAGTAPFPRYFEIVEPAPGSGPAPSPGPVAGEPDLSDAPTAVARDAGRVVLVDERDRVLLFEGADPARPGESFWFTPGGGVEPGEDVRVAAARELGEETGLEVPAADLVGPLWVRDVVFALEGVTYAGREVFFLARVPAGDIDTSGFTELETRTVRGHRWWTPAELAVTVEVVYPHQLAALLADPVALEPAAEPHPIH